MKYFKAIWGWLLRGRDNGNSRRRQAKSKHRDCRGLRFLSTLALQGVSLSPASAAPGSSHPAVLLSVAVPFKMNAALNKNKHHALITPTSLSRQTIQN